MHFPTLPKRWRLPAASEAKKPPKSNATRVTTPRKINPINNASKLSRSVSFNSDNVFKVPATPSSSSSSTASTRLSRSMSRPRHYEAAGEEAAAACPNCQYQSRQDWRSRSLMDLQRQQPQSASVPSSTTAAASRSSSLVRLNPSMQQTTPRGCENQQKLSTSSNNIATIFSNNLRSNSWRNLSVIGQHTNTETGAAARGKHYLGKSIY